MRRRRRHRHLWRQRGRIDHELTLHLGIRIALQRNRLVHTRLRQIGKADGIGGNQSRIGTHVDRQAADRHAFRHRQRADCRATVLDHAVAGLVLADQPHRLQHDVARPDAGRKPAVDANPQCLRHLQPDASGGHRHRDFHSEGHRQRTNSAEPRRMGICARDEHPGMDEPALHHQRMRDPLGVEQVPDALLARVLACQPDALGARDAVYRRFMIDRDHDALGPREPVDADVGQPLHVRRVRQFRHRHQIGLGPDDFAGGDHGATAGACQDLLHQGRWRKRRPAHLRCPMTSASSAA